MKTKKLLLVMLFGSFCFANVKAQQQPICVNDTVTMTGYRINLIRPFLNDINVTFGQDKLDTVKHLGNHTIKSINVDSMGFITNFGQ